MSRGGIGRGRSKERNKGGRGAKKEGRRKAMGEQQKRGSRKEVGEEGRRMMAQGGGTD